MNISVLTPDHTIFTGKITSVILPGVEGSFQLLDNHAPLVSALSGGKVVLQTGGGDYRFYDEETKTMSEDTSSARSMTFTIDRGFVEVLNNEVNLLVQGARNLR
jgi:F-type H+-transporting ATPase subunit epsilon